MIGINIDGKIKTFGSIPEKWNGIHAYNTFEPEVHYEDGFREVVRPTVTDTQKLGAIEYDSVNDVFTYPIIDKSPEEIAQETASEKEAIRNTIREKHEKRTVENSIALNPTDAAAYFYQWVAGTYQIDQIRRFNGKTYRNTIEGNTNAPDKGGWIEIK